MAKQSIPLGVRSNPERTNDDSASVLINCYAEDAGEEGQVRFPIYACDSYSAFSTLTGSGAGAVRGMLNLNDTTLYVVTGSRLNRVNTSGAATDIAAIAGSGPLTMARNRAATPQIAIVPATGNYYILSGNVLTTPTLDPDIDSTLFNSVCAVDGYFLITASNGEWYITAVDGSSIDALDFSTAASNPDGLTRGVVRAPDVALFGPRSTEFVRNTGAADFPFERVHATTIGILAGPTAVALTATMDGSLTDTVIWAATNSDGAYVGIVMLGGYEARKISAPWVDRAVRAATVSTLRAFSYTRNGTTFYCLTSSTFTAEFNTRTQCWHRRKSSGLDIWRIADAVTFNSATTYGDYSSAALYSASYSMVRGTNDLSFRQSFDDGLSWHTTRTKSIGTTGAEETRVKFFRLGQAKEDGRVLEFELSNAVMEAGTGVPMTIRPPRVHAWPNPTRMHQLYVDLTSGASATARPLGVRQISAEVDGQNG